MKTFLESILYIYTKVENSRLDFGEFPAKHEWLVLNNDMYEVDGPFLLEQLHDVTCMLKLNWYFITLENYHKS